MEDGEVEMILEEAEKTTSGQAQDGGVVCPRQGVGAGTEHEVENQTE